MNRAFFFFGVVFTMGSFGCKKVLAPRPTAVVVVDAAPAAPVAPVASAPPAAAGWEQTDGVWIRREGEGAPPLVVRGIVQPVAVDATMANCSELLGGRHGAPPIKLRVLGSSRPLYVFAKARGPIGIAQANVDRSRDDRCASAGAGHWARIVVAQTSPSDDVSIEVADVDIPGERRGQTSPYVVVVSDVDHEPAVDPDPRPASTSIAPSDVVVVRWAIEPHACPESISMFWCARAAIELSGAVTKRIPLKKDLVGQLGCWPQGTGIYCGGPSGDSVISLESNADGSTISVRETSQSDGYCPPQEDCASHVTLTTFKVPPGARLVADPVGVWPPPASR